MPLEASFERILEPCVQAIWPHTTSSQPIISSAYAAGSVWAASRGGAVARWNITAGQPAIASLMLCGHSAPICFVTSGGGLREETAGVSTALLSASEDGVLCVWDSLSGTCQQRQQLQGTPGQLALALGDGVTVCFPLEFSSLEASHFIALFDMQEMHVASMLAPASMISLGYLLHAEQMQRKADGHQILALNIAKDLRGHSVMLGIAQPWQFLCWSLPGPAKAVNAQKPLTAPQPTLAPSLQQQCRMGRLLAASFAHAGHWLLLVSRSGWMLLRAQGQDITRGQYVPVCSAAGSAAPAPSRRDAPGATTSASAADAGPQHDSGAEQMECALAGGQLLPLPELDQQPLVVLWDWRGHAVVHDGNVKGGPALSSSMCMRPAGHDRSTAAPAVPSYTAFHALPGGAQLLQVQAQGHHLWISHLTIPAAPTRSITGHAAWPLDWPAIAVAGALSEGTSLINGSPEEHKIGCASGMVTVLAGDCKAGPAYLAQGDAYGSVRLTPLAAIGMCTAQDRDAMLLWKHPAAITCLAAHQIEAGFGALQHVLVGGCADGSVLAWELSSRQLMMRLYVHAAAVTQLQPAPPGMHTSWDSCVASVGADGMVGILSLQAGGFCQRLLPGHPPGKQLRLQWVSSLGFLACVGSSAPEAGAQHGAAQGGTVAIVWDLQSGKQDRVAVDDAAEQLISNLSRLDTAISTDDQAAVKLLPDTTAAACGIPIIEINVPAILVDQASSLPRPPSPPLQGIARRNSDLGHAAPHRAPARYNSADGQLHSPTPVLDAAASGDEGDSQQPQLRLLATGLSLLHLWGLVDHVDQQLQLMLASLGLLSDTHLAASTAQDPAPPERSSSSCVQPVRVGAHGALTVQVPAWASSTSLHANGPAETQGNPAMEASKLQLRHQPLWETDSRWVTWRQLAVMALAKRLMARGQQLEAVVAGCMSVITFAAVHLRELVPGMAVPDACILAALWQSGSDSIREAARMLLAAALDPRSYALPSGVAPFAAFALIIAAGRHPGRVPANELPGLLQKAMAQWTPLHTVAAAAACLFHPSMVPEDLIAFTLPRLITLVASAPGEGAAEGASVLAEGLLAPSGLLWKPYLGDIGKLMQQLMSVCDSLNASAMERARHSEAGANGIWSTGSSATSEARKCRDSISALLPALAAVDVPLFLHLLWHRLAAGSRGSSLGGADPAGASFQVQGMATLARLLQCKQGPAAVAPHLMLLAAVLMQALDPGQAPLRRACLQAVLAAVKLLCMRFPTVKYHAGTAMLAVGGLPSLAPSPNEPIAVYDMDTGIKKRSLRCSADVPVDGDARGSAAVAFSPAGGLLGAVDAQQGVLRVWRLLPAWSQLLHRGPAALLPSQVIKLDRVLQLEAGRRDQGGRWDMQWNGEASLTVMCNATTQLVKL